MMIYPLSGKSEIKWEVTRRETAPATSNDKVQCTTAIYTYSATNYKIKSDSKVLDGYTNGSLS